MDVIESKFLDQLHFTAHGLKTVVNEVKTPETRLKSRIRLKEI
jgi:hypothetical protein